MHGARHRIVATIVLAATLLLIAGCGEQASHPADSIQAGFDGIDDAQAIRDDLNQRSEVYDDDF